MKVDRILYFFQNETLDEVCVRFFSAPDFYQWDLMVDGEVRQKGDLKPLKFPTISDARRILNNYLKKFEA